MEENLQQQNSDSIRIVIYGPESTGKTTLAKALARRYQTNWVPEFARDYLQNKWDLNQDICNLEDLIIIAKGQIEAENKRLKTAKNFLFCDTNILVTQIWSETHFNGYCDPRIKLWVNTFQYDHYFLTNIDVPWKSDDLRDQPKERKRMFNFFKDSLIKRNLPFTILKGNHETRIIQAQKILKKLSNK
jgi:NadR type nicotinamide-nucleotide adenylyltransferase